MKASYRVSYSPEWIRRFAYISHNEKCSIKKEHDRESKEDEGEEYKSKSYLYGYTSVLLLLSSMIIMLFV